MERNAIRSALFGVLSLAVLASVAPASARLPIPIEGRQFPEPAPVVEYLHAASNLYFITVDSGEMTAIDANPAGGWARVSNRAAFFTIVEPVTVRDASGSVLPALPVCRFFVPPASHFFSASPTECAAVREAHPGLVLETEAAFYAWLPDMAGRCPRVLSHDGFVSLAPVYRLWNAQGETNHRYTASVVERAAMIETGWISEGYGDTGVAMCVPQ